MSGGGIGCPLHNHRQDASCGDPELASSLNILITIATLRALNFSSLPWWGWQVVGTSWHLQIYLIPSRETVCLRRPQGLSPSGWTSPPCSLCNLTVPLVGGVWAGLIIWGQISSHILYNHCSLTLSLTTKVILCWTLRLGIKGQSNQQFQGGTHRSLWVVCLAPNMHAYESSISVPTNYSSDFFFPVDVISSVHILLLWLRSP